MITYRGKWALVTGASSGIGEEFAWRLARRGVNLILTARREERLNLLAQQLRQTHGIQTETVIADLSQASAPQAVFDKVRNLAIRINILVNNAGVGVYGPFHETPLADNQRLAMLNIGALMSLTHLFLPDMVKAREGYIFHLSSIAAFQPVAYMASYAASKAFVLSFSEALWAEYRNLGVRVLAVCPGATETGFFDAMGSRAPVMGNADSAENVVEKSLRAMELRKCSIVTGPFLNHVMAQLNRISPRSMVASVGERLLRPTRRGK